MTFPPIKYVVPGILVEGLTLFAGKPKIGKSWLLLHAAIAVARSGFTLGDIKCIEGDVLYCALEDNLRRLQSRMTKLLRMQPWPKRLEFRCEMPRLTEGGLDVIKTWIKNAKHPRLIIIDILARVRSAKKKDQQQYDADYDCVVELRKLANEHGIAVVVVHHQRKMDADDPFDTISGTLGLTGVPDSVLVLALPQRCRSPRNAAPRSPRRSGPRGISGHAAAALPTSVMNVRRLRSSDGGISRVIPLKELLHGA
jgi:RecA-family ATPase